jgi:uncharacterized RDD family membrane protein YckC
MPMLKLVGIEGPLRGKSRLLTEGEYSIGRDGCDITIPDAKVSTHHARLAVASTHVTIEDSDSMNGTYVNDPKRTNRIFFETLHDQDTFALGPNTAFGIHVFELHSAGFWIRALAMLIDGAVLAPIQFGLAILIGYLVGVSYSKSGVELTIGDVESMKLVAGSLVWLGGVVASFLYVGLMNGARGQTLGKMATGIKIIRMDGRDISYGTAFLRYFMQILLGSLSLGIMYIFLAAQPQKRGWYEMAADTRVVYVKEL